MENNSTRANAIDVRIGEMRIDSHPKILKTVLGSCVALIIYDKVHRIGGLAHIFLPEKKNNHNGEPDSKFADTAVPALINAVIEKGGRRNHLFAFMVGGGNVFKSFKKSNLPTVAELNIKMTKEAIQEAKIPLLGCDVGRDNGCKVTFDLSNGDMKIVDLQAIKFSKDKT